jgi:hypothetical protein
VAEAGIQQAPEREEHQREHGQHRVVQWPSLKRLERNARRWRL